MEKLSSGDDVLYLPLEATGLLGRRLEGYLEASFTNLENGKADNHLILLVLWFCC